jgi:hypothetical protein
MGATADRPRNKELSCVFVDEENTAARAALNFLLRQKLQFDSCPCVADRFNASSVLFASLPRSLNAESGNYFPTLLSGQNESRLPIRRLWRWFSNVPYLL